jgi:uncharacterized protein (TIGR02118 family)
VIHQLIFAHPKPGMTEKDFQDYWVNVHAVNFAGKIPQIKKYLVDTRIPFGEEPADPRFSGIAEIWLNNEVEQVASLQTPEFLQGARLDEPNWAAFWRTVGVDTSAHVLLEGPPLSRDSKFIKLVAMVKRKEGVPIETFRRYSLGIHGPLGLKLPGLRRYLQCHVRDGLYAIGEPVLDAVMMLWFDDVAALRTALDSPENIAAAADLPNFIEMKYAHTFVVEEHWIIGPEPRP